MASSKTKYLAASYVCFRMLKYKEQKDSHNNFFDLKHIETDFYLKVTEWVYQSTKRNDFDSKLTSRQKSRCPIRRSIIFQFFVDDFFVRTVEVFLIHRVTEAILENAQLDCENRTTRTLLREVCNCNDDDLTKNLSCFFEEKSRQR